MPHLERSRVIAVRTKAIAALESAMDVDQGQSRYVYDVPWNSFALAWANVREPQFKFAVASFLESDANRIQVVEHNPETNRLECVAEAETLLPTTKLVWGKPDLLASSCQTVNLWRLEGGQLTCLSRLGNPRSSGCVGNMAPVTAFDWSSSNPKKLGVASVDTTCTIFNLEKLKIESQLIAHDKAVHDIAFGKPDTLFVSAGADGSVRLFDQRQLEVSTIIYETSSPLLRVAWNTINTNYVATIAEHERGITVFDIRRPFMRLEALVHRESFVNHLCWAPGSKRHLLCGTDDGHALIWDFKQASTEEAAASAAGDMSRTGSAAVADSTAPRSRHGPLLAYEVGEEVNQVQWTTANPEWVALGTAKRFEVLQI